MSFLSYFFPQTILITTSAHNHLIRVNEECGRLKLLVNGSRQSGSYIENLWKKAFRAFSIQSDTLAHSILILGVGGGTVITLLHDYFPDAAMKCVDIDPTILMVAKKYFHVDQIPHTTYVCQDAEVFSKEDKVRKSRYDVIIVDLFSGRHIPEFVVNKEFIASIRSILNRNGILLINYLREREYQKKSDGLLHKLFLLFPEAKDFPIENNRFFYAKHE